MKTSESSVSGDAWIEQLGNHIAALSALLAQRRPVDDPTILTAREAELLQRLAGGASYGQIATEWGCQLNTVHRHAHHVLSKLGARSMTQAVYLAFRMPEPTELLSQPSTPCPLSGRQLEVLRLVANGNTSQEAAAFLGMSRDGVRTVLQVLYRSLGVRSQAHAVAVAVGRGWIRPDEIRTMPSAGGGEEAA